jgi:nicotinate-nucleotide pyrophosphorylase (carboxylating)
MKDSDVDRIILNALYEDIGTGDITTSSIVPEGHVSEGVIIAKDEFVLAGMPFARRAFCLIDQGVEFNAEKGEGSRVKRGEVLATLRGRTRSLLMAERVALNILQRLSGIATQTRRFVERVKGTNARIVDTRKTAPGIRVLDKYAVRIGGGYNHRYGLYDGLLIKDNHLLVAGGVENAVRLARLNAPHLLRVEVEVKNLKEVREAIRAGADVIMLDNMAVREIKRAVELIRKEAPSVLIEVSGGVRLEDVGPIAKTGVDLISVGSLTHSVTAPDISMEIKASRSGHWLRHSIHPY